MVLLILAFTTKQISKNKIGAKAPFFWSSPSFLNSVGVVINSCKGTASQISFTKPGLPLIVPFSSGNGHPPVGWLQKYFYPTY